MPFTKWCMKKSKRPRSDWRAWSTTSAPAVAGSAGSGASSPEEAAAGGFAGSAMSRSARIAGSLVVVGAVFLLLPGQAHAWTPGTHIFLGQSILSAASQLPATVGDLIRAFPFDFLYGNIAADTSFAKKYAPINRHRHAWHVGQELHDLARTHA